MDLRETTDQPRHPWEIARMRFFRDVVRRAGLPSRVRTVLDGGAGDAWFARQLLDDLPADAKIRCWDAEYTDAIEADLRARLPDRMELVRTRPDTAHDLVTLLDVLEHVEDDTGFLADIVDRSLAPGGWLLMSVPARQGLYTQHDTFLHHHRRYAPGQARSLLQGAGLQIVKSGGLFHSLLAPRALEKLRETMAPKPGDHQPAIAWRQGQFVTQTIVSVLAADNAVSQVLAGAGVDMPGLSWFALCRKPA